MVSTSRAVATFSTSRVSVVVSRIVGNALNSCGVRIASVVKSTTTAIVKFAESRTSSTPAGIGTTNTRIAPMKATGMTSPRRIPSAGTGCTLRSAFWEASFPLPQSPGNGMGVVPTLKTQSNGPASLPEPSLGRALSGERDLS